MYSVREDPVFIGNSLNVIFGGVSGFGYASGMDVCSRSNIKFLLR